jgi:hypothetical protein
MCNLIYRKLNELMLSTNEYEVDIKFPVSDITIRIFINISNYDYYLFFYTLKEGRKSESLGDINLRKIPLNTTGNVDPIASLCAKHKNDKEDVSTIYDKWFKELKNSLEKLIEKEKKYFAISDEIKSLSLFSPTREVLFEKIIN